MFYVGDANEMVKAAPIMPSGTNVQFAGIRAVRRQMFQLDVPSRPLLKCRNHTDRSIMVTINQLNLPVCRY